MGTVSGFSDENNNTYSTQGSTGSMLTNVENVRGSIGYVNLGVIPQIDASTTTVVSIDGITPTPDTVLDGTYEISRNLILVTGMHPSDSVDFFLAWILSPQGQKIVEDEGFVPIGPTSL